MKPLITAAALAALADADPASDAEPAQAMKAGRRLLSVARSSARSLQQQQVARRRCVTARR